MNRDYESFVAAKLDEVPPVGFSVDRRRLDSGLYPFQGDLVQWALERGRSALFEDCGLGKTRQQLAWARHVAEHTRGQVLILAPLAVAAQTIEEGARIDIPVRYATAQGEATDPITITNYERLERFDPAAFAGVVLDESSILKAYSGKVKQRLVQSFAATPFRLCCTATPAPNDHLELGNHSEFLSVLTGHEMIARWFLPDTSTFGTYRLKGHAIGPYWDWVASWARCLGKPSDLGPGYSDEGYVLPELVMHKHVLGVDVVTGREDGALFRVPDLSATAVHREKRLTAPARAAAVAELVAAEPGEQWIVWCDTDYEADALTAVIPDAVEVRGSDRVEDKERDLQAFTHGSIRVLVTKPSIAGFGLNWQHCARVAFVGPTFSFEQYYQAVRRSWRFGQHRPVQVHVTLAQTEVEILAIMQRKAEDHRAMQAQMFEAMRRAQARSERRAHQYEPHHQGRLPAWLTTQGRAA